MRCRGENEIVEKTKDLAVELEKVYDSEINLEISWFWDAGIEIRLGDRIGGFLAEENVPAVDAIMPGSGKRSHTFIRIQPTPPRSNLNSSCGPPCAFSIDPGPVPPSFVLIAAPPMHLQWTNCLRSCVHGVVTRFRRSHPKFSSLTAVKA